MMTESAYLSYENAWWFFHEGEAACGMRTFSISGNNFMFLRQPRLLPAADKMMPPPPFAATRLETLELEKGRPLPTDRSG